MRQRDPWFSKRLVSRRLRALRERRERTQQDVADSMEWSLSKLIRIENATVHISISDLKALLGEYGADQTETTALLDAARASRQEPWVAEYGSAVVPRLRRLIAYESAARSIYQFQLQVVPGLMQTEPYARALLASVLADEVVADQLDPAVAVRVERQRRLLDEDPPELNLIIDESVLRRPIGGVGVMRHQLEHLMAMADRPWLSVAVVPLTAGAHMGLNGSFSLMELEPEAGIDTVVDIGAEGGGEHLTSRDDELARKYWSRYDDLAKVADAGDAAMTILKRCHSQMGNQ
jgi:transcriptional regulator with XRE-family HTH domain